MSKLPPDATLTYIIDNGLLNKPSDWIRDVYRNLLSLPKDRGPYCVRIGLSGTGHGPNYRIEPLHEPEETPEDRLASITNIPDTPRWAYLLALNNAYDGRSHKHSTKLSGLARDNWSAKTSTEQDIKDRRGYIPQRRRLRSASRNRPVFAR